MLDKLDFDFYIPKLNIDLTKEKPRPDLDTKINTWYDPKGNISAYGWLKAKNYTLELVGIAFYSFVPNAKEVLAIPHSNVAPDLVFDHFYRTVLPLFFQASGIEALHSSAVLTPKGVIGFCAVSGTGKSTLAYVLSQSTYSLWADDALVWKAFDQNLYTFKLPSETLLHDHTFEYFHKNTESILKPKNTHILKNNKNSFLSSLFILERSSNPNNVCSIDKLSPKEAFSELLTHAYVFELDDLSRKKDLIKNYLDLAEKIPTYKLSFFPDLNKITFVIDLVKEVVETS
jgi:hypothetical protein